MKKSILIPIAGVVALLSACIPSVNPLYTAKDLVFDPRLLGAWVEQDKPQETTEGWTFEKAGETTYKLTVVEDKGKRGEFEARLVKLKNHLFLDVTPSQIDIATNQADMTQWALIPGHLILRVYEVGPELKLNYMDPEWLKKYLGKYPKALAHVYDEGRGLNFITASTQDLQKFVLAHLGKGELFGDPGVFVRRANSPPAAAAPAK